MNVAVHVAQMNAVNTAVMAANSAARNARNTVAGGETKDIGWGEFIGCVVTILVCVGLLSWMLWEVI